MTDNNKNPQVLETALFDQQYSETLFQLLLLMNEEDYTSDRIDIIKKILWKRRREGERVEFTGYELPL